MGTRLNPVRSFVSELSVPGQPGSQLFRVADVVAGVLIVAFAAGIAVWLGQPRGRFLVAGRWGCGLLAFVGALCLLDAACPMSCPPSIDQMCDRAERSGSLLAQVSDVHTISGVLSVIVAAIAMALVGLRLRHSGLSRCLARVSVGCTMAMLLLGGLLTATYLLDLPWLGSLERAQLLIQSIWLTLLAAAVIRPPVAPRATSATGAGLAMPMVVLYEST
jgi:hypothetical protein